MDWPRNIVDKSTKAAVKTNFILYKMLDQIILLPSQMPPKNRAQEMIF